MEESVGSQKRVIITGQSGLSKKEYLTKVLEKTKKEGHNVKLFNIGDMMYEEAEKTGGKITPGLILNLPILRLASIRRSVFKDVLHFSEKNQDISIIVNTHSVFRWEMGLFHAFDFDLMDRFNPDFYITLIDDVDSIYLRLQQREDLHFKDFTLKDIMVWREEEIITTEMVARTQKKLHFVLPRKNPLDTIAKLMFKPNTKRAYLSYPMSLVRHKQDVVDKIIEFRNLMADRMIVFDPIAIEEKRLLYHMNEAQKQEPPKNLVKLETLGKELEMEVSEIKSIEKDIDGQIFARDLKFIEQSDMVIAYIAERENEPQLSDGSQTEVVYAYGLPREVYVIWPSSKEPSVWKTGFATKVFKGESAFEEIVEYLKERGYIE